MLLATMLPKIAGTESFRLSGSALFDNYKYSMGRNMQNITKNMRKYFGKLDGYSVVQVDQAGAEALIVAMECFPGKLRALFEAKIKPHTFVAGWVFGDQFIEKGVKPEYINAIKSCTSVDKILALPSLPFWKELDKLIRSSDDWPSDQRYYFMGKTGCHSGNYGAGYRIIQRTALIKSNGAIRISDKVAKEFNQIYTRELFPELPAWHVETETKLTKNRKLVNLFGFPRYLTGVIGNLPEWIAWVPQSTVGVITHKAAALMEKFIEANKLDWHLINNCHDSLAYLAPDDQAKACAEQLTIFMQQRLVSSRGEEYNMKAEASIGKNWGPKSSKNPEGVSA